MKLLRRAPVLVALAIALGAFLLFGPKLPKDQTVNIVLGSAAPRVSELVLRYREELTEEVLREVSLRYPHNDAPRVVRHEARLADGTYALEIELLTNGSRATLRRTIALTGGASTQVDVTSALATAVAPLDGGAP